MIRFLMFSLIGTFLFSASSYAGFNASSYAGPLIGGGGMGPSAVFHACSGVLNDGVQVSFEVRATAAVGVVDAVLVNAEDNSLIDHFLCKRGGDIVDRAPSAGEVVWVCKEYKTPRLNISVQLDRGGVTGQVTGQILLAQIFPLAPEVVGRLICQ
jgi:hypothetical protein